MDVKIKGRNPEILLLIPRTRLTGTPQITFKLRPAYQNSQFFPPERHRCNHNAPNFSTRLSYVSLVMMGSYVDHVVPKLGTGLRLGAPEETQTPTIKNL